MSGRKFWTELSKHVLGGVIATHISRKMDAWLLSEPPDGGSEIKKEHALIIGVGVLFGMWILRKQLKEREKPKGIMKKKTLKIEIDEFEWT